MNFVSFLNNAINMTLEEKYKTSIKIGYTGLSRKDLILENSFTFQPDSIYKVQAIYKDFIELINLKRQLLGKEGQTKFFPPDFERSTLKHMIEFPSSYEKFRYELFHTKSCNKALRLQFLRNISIGQKPIKTRLNDAISVTLKEKYETSLKTGYLGARDNLIYYKPDSIDDIIREIYKDFAELTDLKRELLGIRGKTKWQLPPYFEEGSIGGHITVVNSRELRNNPSISLESISEAHKIFVPEDGHISIVNIKKVTPPNWKGVQHIQLITLLFEAIGSSRELNNLPTKIEGRFDPHLTFAIKKKLEDSSYDSRNSNRVTYLIAIPPPIFGLPYGNAGSFVGLQPIFAIQNVQSRDKSSIPNQALRLQFLRNLLNTK